MRITNNIILHNTSININGNKGNVDTLNNQMTSQKKIQRPSDDPVTAIRALRLRSTLSEIDQYYEKNIPDAYSAETKTKLAAEWHKMRQQIDSIGTQVKQGLAIQEKLLQELRQQRSVAELMPDLKRMMDHNEELEQLPLFGMMVSYAQTEEYALGDEIYQKEEMGIEELVEKNYTLYQGYERAVSLLTEDIEMYA